MSCSVGSTTRSMALPRISTPAACKTPCVSASRSTREWLGRAVGAADFATPSGRRCGGGNLTGRIVALYVCGLGLLNPDHGARVEVPTPDGSGQRHLSEAVCLTARLLRYRLTTGPAATKLGPSLTSLCPICCSPNVFGPADRRNARGLACPEPSRSRDRSPVNQGRLPLHTCPDRPRSSSRCTAGRSCAARPAPQRPNSDSTGRLGSQKWVSRDREGACPAWTSREALGDWSRRRP